MQGDKLFVNSNRQGYHQYSACFVMYLLQFLSIELLKSLLGQNILFIVHFHKSID